MKKLKRIFALITLIILVSITLNIYPTKAVTTTLYASGATVESGGEFNVSITSSIKLSGWTISLTSNGGCTFLSASGVEVNGQSVFGTSSSGETSLATYKFRAPSVTEDTTCIISFSGSEMCDSTDEAADVSPTNCSATITIKAPAQQPPAVTEPEPTNPGSSGNPTPQPGENTNTIPQDNPEPQEQEKSRNYYLSSLKVNDGQRELDVKQTNNTSAGFNREVEEYTIVFPDEYKFEELTTVRIAATAEDSKAKISGVGEKTVNEGDNTFEVSCTAENGSVKTYRIKLTKPVIINKSELKLDSLAIETVKDNGDKEVLKLDKDFKNDVYEYTCDLASDIKALNIKLLTSKVKEQDLIVKINGKEISRDLEGKLETEVFNLEDGKNTIRITLVSPTDESVTTDYVITANREAKVVETVEEKKGFSIRTEDLPKIIIGVICGIILLLVIILVVLLVINNKQKKQEKGQTETSDEPKEDDDKDSNDSYLSDKNLERLNKEYAKIDEENSEEAKTTERVETKSDLDKEDKKSEPNEELELLNKNIREMEEVIKLQEDVQNSDNADDIDAEFELESREKDYENTSEESRRQKIDELINEIKNKQKDKKKDDDDK